MTSVAVFIQFMARDFKIFMQRLRVHMLNYGFISPVLLAGTFGYVLPWISLGESATRGSTVMFAGGILWSLFPLANSLTMDLVFDLERERFVGYQMSVLHPSLVIIQRILFSSFVCTVCMAMFVPVTKLVMQDRFVLSNASFWQMGMVIFCGALFCCSYAMASQTWISSSRKIKNLWLRLYYPMLMLAGSMCPWKAYMKVSPLLGYITLCNPLMYLSEAMRSAILGGDEFFSVSLSLIVIIASTVVCIALSLYNFKKRVDHI